MFPDYPYTDAHQLNLDWLVTNLTELKEELDSGSLVGPPGPEGEPGDTPQLTSVVYKYAYVQSMTSLTPQTWYDTEALAKNAFGDISGAVLCTQITYNWQTGETYWWNRNVTRTYQGKDGEQGEQGPAGTVDYTVLASQVTDWLDDNITQETGYVIDTSLSVAGAAADAKATGDAIGELTSDINELSAEKISKEKIGGIWKEFVFPPAFLGTFKPVKLFTDGKFWKTDFNKEDWKFTAVGAKTYYVDPTGTYLNDGLSPDKPVPMYNAINRSSDGDTIIVAEGDYRNDTVSNAAIPSITKSLNIIGHGNVRFSKSSKKTPTYDSVSGLYTVTQAAMQGVYDPDMDIYYTIADTLADCQATVNSIYYGNAPTVYINMTYQHDIIAMYNDIMFVVDNSGADVQVYVENIEFAGGGCCFQTNTTNTHSCLVVFEKCRFTYNVGASNNVVKIASAKAIFHKCVARYSRNDGFAYTVTENGANTGFVEIDCESYNNGFNLSSDTSNGSTAHSGICGIRVNGIYHGSKGGNVVDVQTGTQTINCGCSAFNSVATQDGYNEGFGIQQAGATQWLYNCVAFGNFYDFYGVPSSEQIAFRSSHIKDNYSFDYSGTLTDTQPKTLEEINFENSAKISQQL